MSKPEWPVLRNATDLDSMREALGRLDDDLRAMLVRGLGAENFSWPIVQWRLTDGVESAYDSPISGIPQGFFPISAVNVSDNTPLKITGWQLNTTRADRKLGITVSFGTASATGLVKCWLVGG